MDTDSPAPARQECSNCYTVDWILRTGSNGKPLCGSCGVEQTPPEPESSAASSQSQSQPQQRPASSAATHVRGSFLLGHKCIASGDRRVVNKTEGRVTLSNFPSILCDTPCSLKPVDFNVVVCQQCGLGTNRLHSDEAGIRCIDCRKAKEAPLTLLRCERPGCKMPCVIFSYVGYERWCNRCTYTMKPRDESLIKPLEYHCGICGRKSFSVMLGETGICCLRCLDGDVDLPVIHSNCAWCGCTDNLFVIMKPPRASSKQLVCRGCASAYGRTVEGLTRAVLQNEAYEEEKAKVNPYVIESDEEAPPAAEKKVDPEPSSSSKAAPSPKRHREVVDLSSEDSNATKEKKAKQAEKDAADAEVEAILCKDDPLPPVNSTCSSCGAIGSDGDEIVDFVCKSCA